MATPKLVLHYFAAPGRAEPIRIAFAIGGVAFEDKHHTGPEFGALKQGTFLPFGQLPVLEVDDVVIPQSNAIHRYAGKLAGTYLNKHLSCDPTYL